MSTRARSPVARHSSPKDVLSFLLLSLFIFLVGPSVGRAHPISDQKGGEDTGEKGEEAAAPTDSPPPSHHSHLKLKFKGGGGV